MNKRYLVLLKPSQCSCARQVSKNSSSHLPFCELRQPVTEPRQDLARVYKAVVERERSLIYNPLIPLLQTKKTVSFDIDLLNTCEPGVNKFIAECRDIHKIQMWSSLVALQDVDALR
jgi:hypothetical protein